MNHTRILLAAFGSLAAFAIVLVWVQSDSASHSGTVSPLDPAVVRLETTNNQDDTLLEPPSSDPGSPAELITRCRTAAQTEKDAAIEALLRLPAESLPDLLAALSVEDDPVVADALVNLIARHADVYAVQSLADQYEASADQLHSQRILAIVSALRTPSAMQALMVAVRDQGFTAQDPFILAAAHSLCMTGDPAHIDAILARIEPLSAQEGALLASEFANITNPAAATALIPAAVGSKEITSLFARSAAVYALTGLPGEEIDHVLENLCRDPAEDVAAAAKETLALRNRS
jgi:hypothetical protein